MTQNEIERETAEFNMAVNYLSQLNILLGFSKDASINLQMDRWMHIQLTLFRSLSSEMTDKEIEYFEKMYFYEINPLIQELNKTINKMGVLSVNHELLYKLHRTEMELYKILKKSGLLMKMKKGASEALE